MKKHTAAFVTLGVCALVVVIVALFMPVLDGPGSHQRAKESVAVGNLRRVTELQTHFAAANPGKGFACRLAELRQAQQPEDSDARDQFLVSDSYAGYVLSLSGCERGQNGMVTQYRVTAVPIHHSSQDSGLRAFCADQSGQIWYDPSGSAENCFASRRPI